MAKHQARINTSFGQIIVGFDEQEDLSKALEAAPNWIKAINDNSARLQIESKVITGFEDLYVAGPAGVPRLLKHPKKKSDIVRLALFLAPQPLEMKQWQEASGVSNPLAYVKQQDVIRSAEGRYSLEAAARSYVLDKVIPALRAGAES